MVNNIIDEWVSQITMPCIKNFPYRHVNYRCVMPVGAQARVSYGD